MGTLLQRIEKRASTLAGGSLENPANWVMRAFALPGTAAGVEVTERNALYAVDVFTCVRIISETIAQLPFPLYAEIPGGGKERARQHPLYSVLQNQANEEMSAFTFKETLQAHLLTWGNAYAWIERDEKKDVVGLWPLLPDRTFAFRENGKLKYRSRIKKLPTPDLGDERIFDARDVFHIPGLGFDGLVGYSVIGYLREQIGLSMAQEEYQGRFFSNGSTPPVVLKTEKQLQPEDVKRIQASWEEAHRGVKKAWATAVLEEGMEVEKIGMPAVEAQFIEQRRFSSEKIYGFYRVPPHMVGATEKATSYGQGIAQQQVGFAQYTIQPWAVRWEGAVWMRLLSESDRKKYFAEFLMDGIQRGDIKTRYEAYAMAFGKWMTTDDIRERETMNPYKAPEDEKQVGKMLLWPLNMRPAEKVAVAPVESKKEPRPPDDPAGAKPGDEPPLDEDVEEEESRARRAIARAHRVAFTDVAERILRREQADILRAKTRDLPTWLEAFYADHEEYIRKQVGPQLRTIAEMVSYSVTRELGVATVAPAPFVEAYIESYGRRHAQTSLAELRGQPQEALEAIFATWAVRPAWVAARETVQAANAFAKAAYREAGVTELVWVAGDDCESCRGLAGAPVAIGAPFIRRGMGGPDHFIPANGLGHPPLCDGCECVVVAHRTRTRSAPRTAAA